MKRRKDDMAAQQEKKLGVSKHEFFWRSWKMIFFHRSPSFIDGRERLPPPIQIFNPWKVAHDLEIFNQQNRQKINHRHHNTKPSNVSHNDIRIRRDARLSLLGDPVTWCDNCQPAMQSSINFRRVTVIRRDLSYNHLPTNAEMSLRH